MKKRKPLTQTVFEGITCVAGGVISFSYFFSLGHDSKIIGPFINSVFEPVERIVGEIVANVLFLLSFFASGFLLTLIALWCLNRLVENSESRMKSKNSKQGNR